MNRRAFLQSLGAALVGTTLDPERLLWVPGAKTIFLPAVRVLRDYQSGIAIRFVRGWDIQADKDPFRFDLLMGIPDQTPFANSGVNMRSATGRV